MPESIAQRVIAGELLRREDALGLFSASGQDVFDIFASANRIREACRGSRADLCAIVSAKTGSCPEDCSYCAQSARAKTDVKSTSLVDIDLVVERARRAKQYGAARFCIVTSGKRLAGRELEKVAGMVRAVRDEGLLPCATLGLLGSDELLMLKEAGLYRYHHNLETSRRHFPRICSSHTYDEKLATIDAVKSAGLSLCSGGIFGLGEGWEDRVDMALELRELGADSVPINFLVPIKGTPLGDVAPLRPLEALKIVSLYRFLLPWAEVRVAGGRLQTLGEFNSMVFMAGADGLLTGDCLTVTGRDPGDDLRMVEAYGMHT